MPSTESDGSDGSRSVARAPASPCRRDVLTGAASVAALGTAGCLNVLDSSDDATAGASGDWPTYRGDWQRTGLKPADAGPGESLSIAWETSFLDVVKHREDGDVRLPAAREEGYEGTIATGYFGDVTTTEDHVLTSVYYRRSGGGADDEPGWGGVVAFDADDGSVEWTIPGIPGRLQAPTVIDGRLYLTVLYPADADAEGNHLLVADASDGTVEERYPLDADLRDSTTITSDSVLARSPHDGEGSIVSYDRSSGDRRWTSDAAAPTVQLPAFTLANGSLYYASASEEGAQLVSLDPESGEEAWRRTFDVPRQPGSSAPEHLGVPTVVDGTGYVAGGWRAFSQDDVGGSALRSFDLENGEDDWTFRPEGVPYGEASTDLANPLQCPSGEDCYWTDGYAALHGTPLVLDDVVVVSGFGRPAPNGFEHDAHRHVYGVSAEDGSLEWSVPGAAPSAVAAGDVIYVRFYEDSIAAIGTDGTLLGRVQSEGGPTWGYAPAIGHGRLYATWRGYSGGTPRFPGDVVAIE